MNIKKFKSVAVAIETYKLLKKIAAADDRSAGMQITYLVKQEAKKRKLAAWKQKPLCQGLGHTDHLNQNGSMKGSVAMSVTKNTSRIIWWVLKKVVIFVLGFVLDVTIYCKNHRYSMPMWDDTGECIYFHILFAVSNFYAWLCKKWDGWF